MNARRDGSIGLMELERVLRGVDPRVVLLPRRVLRRVIKHDRKITSLGLQVPHRKTYLLDASAAGDILARDELGLDPEAEVSLVGPLILIERPEPKALERIPRELALRKYWRLLFHARVDLEIDRRLASGALTPEGLRQRVWRITPLAFDEARAILRYEDYLLPPRDLAAVYREFAAVYLELRHFAARLLPVYFPAISDHEAIDAVLALDIDAARLFEETYLPDAAAPEADPAAGLDPDLAPAADRTQTLERIEPPASPEEAGTGGALRRHRVLNRRADRAAARGNNVRAAILRMRASRLAASGEASSRCVAAAKAELDHLTERLAAGLELSADQATSWRGALAPLLEPASAGLWASEVRLLFDLQKVCVDHERPIFAIDLVEHVLSRFRRPIKRSLPCQREVLICKHLHRAAWRLSSARLDDVDRSRLDALLHRAVVHAEAALRERVRPRTVEALERTGLRARTVVERVALAKLVEELLDQVVARGYLSMGHLRDAIARNNLKLHDLSSVSEFFRGDRLLRADRQLAIALDGVYRRGEVYVRWLQRFSSLGFGTPAGRFVTQYVVLPFGGAFVALKFSDHLAAKALHLVQGAPPPAPPHASAPPPPARLEVVLASPAEADPDPADATTTELAEGFTPTDQGDGTIAMTEAAAGHGHGRDLIPREVMPWATLALGLLLLGVLHVPKFRAALGEFFRSLYRVLKGLLIDLPQWFFDRPWIRRFFESRTFQFLWRLIVKPIVPALAGWVWLRLVGLPPATAGAAAMLTFVAVAVFLNLRIGRDLEEIAGDSLARTWRVIRVNIVVGIIQWIVDFFAGLLEFVDRLLYSVDEWLRFRGGENRAVYVAKAALGVVWFYVAYAVRFIVNLLVEPQINPIKHFPVVTVSHKVLFPLLLYLIPLLSPTLGKDQAATVWFLTQLLLPGVFGFLVWELKENWRLYLANQPARLTHAVIGHHGESMLRLLRPGFHSGTVPKLYTRLRHVERRALIRGVPRRLAVRRLKSDLHHVEESVARFIRRELLELWRQTTAMRDQAVVVGQVDLSTNRIRAAIGCLDLGPDPLILSFAFRSGWILSGIDAPGWLDRLDDDERRTIEASLAGLYHLATTDLVAQDLDDDLPVPSGALEFNDQGLVFWLGDPPETEATYVLSDRGRIAPQIDGPRPIPPLPVLEAERVLLRHAPIAWDRWVATWEAEQSGQAPAHPYLPSFALLPPPEPLQPVEAEEPAKLRA